VLAAIVVVALAGSAFGQAGKPGGRGFMGFGGGMMASPSVSWGMLLRSEKVQKELELVDDQKAKLKEIADNFTTKVREAMPRRQEGQELTREQQEARFAEMRKKMEALAEENRKAIEGVLLPHQIQRLKQLSVQLLGNRALDDKEVQDALGLTADQKEKIKQVREEQAKKGRELFTGEGSREGMREKFESLRKETEQKLMDVLTAEQKEKFEKLKGAKFEFEFPGPGGPGGFGPGRGGPGRAKR
jgi:Spy/CpxP family protein refolding chaperone